MHPGATLFFDVCVQADFWPDGAWPVMTGAEAANVARLFAVAARFGARQGGLVCRHDATGAEPAEGAPAHCTTPAAADRRPDGCAPRLPLRVHGAGVDDGPLERTHAIYVASGCGADPDHAPARAEALGFLTSGVRDAVVFGAGVEAGLAHAVDLLLRRRIRTHVALDAVGAIDPIAAQQTIGGWKRRGVDGATVDTIERLLSRG